MAIWASIPPDHDHPQIQPPAEVRSAESLGVPKWPEFDPKNPIFILRRKVSSSVGGIIHAAERQTINQDTAKKAIEIKGGQESKEVMFERKYKQLHEIIDKEEQVWNIDKLLNTQTRGKLLETHIYSIYGGWFDKSGNIILKWNVVIIKWTPKYNQMLEKALEEFRAIWHALLNDAQERWRDPDTIRKLP